LLTPGFLLVPATAAVSAPKPAAPTSYPDFEWLGSANTPAGHQTTGEKRFLEPDLSKTFDTSLARFGSRGSTSSGRAARTAPFGGTKMFGSQKSASLDKSFPSSAFHTPQFLTKSSPTRAYGTSSFSGVGTAPTPRTTSTGNPIPTGGFPTSTSRLASSSAAYAQREFAGPEADKKKIPYTPANGPQGGVSYGRVLSVEEVREILNKSK
jgi:hypothetical protein